MAATPRAANGDALPGRATPQGAPQAALARALGAVQRRIRVQRALGTCATLGIAGLASAALGVALRKTGWQADARVCFALAWALPVLGLALGALRPVPRLLAARLLDRALGTPDPIASAWSFAVVEPAARTPFMRACLQAAHGRAAQADPARALPLREPRALRPALVLGLGVLALSALEVRVPAAPRTLQAQRPRLLHEDDVQAFRQEIAPILHAEAVDPGTREAARELNALLEALRDGRLDRARALAALRGLERRLEAADSAGDERALREALQALGRTLGRDSLAQSVADALRDADAAQARNELEKLAHAIDQHAPSAEAARKLERALARAAQRDHDAQSERLQRARAQLDRLLKKKRDAANPQSEQERRLLQKKQRELDRLRREQQQREQAERQLDALRRELGSAGGSLGSGSRQAAAGHLQQGAQSLGQAQHAQRSAEQRRRLRERVQELRELISKQRQQQQAGAGRPGQRGKGALSLQRFARDARGEQPKAGGEGKQHGKLLMPGQGGGEPGATLIVPGARGGDAQLLQEAQRNAGPAAGRGGRPEQGAPTRLDSSHVDTRVAGVEGEGPTRSEVIREAGQHGFVSESYRRVHADYERHAEAVLERDKIPGGYRFYVRRYFQLIRPREENP